MAATPAYVFPEALLRVRRDASSVVEASAGTGKTYLLEHLVADRILRGDARLEEILVVTFTEKATAELVRRLRALIDRLLAHKDAAPAGTDPELVWTLDAAARRRLVEARQSFDRATITTIHGFCQRVLTEDAFSSGRLLVQEHVDSKRAFRDAFKDALRSTLTTDARLGAYVRAWLAGGKSMDVLERTLYTASAQQRPWAQEYDEDGLRAALAAFADLTIDETFAFTLNLVVKNKTTSKSATVRLRNLHEVARHYAAHGDAAQALFEIDGLVSRTTDQFSYLEKRLTMPFPPGPAKDAVERFLAIADTALPLELAAAQLFLPHVRRRLDERKAATGRYDFDDMLRLVAGALARPNGRALIESLRRRYRLAIIDEFQDTDGVQWDIFRTIFQASGGTNPLTVIGDPKQAIYGFRGADVMTYEEARRTITGGDAATLALDRNFRSTPAVLSATNDIFDAAAAAPFFEDRALFREAVPGVEASPSPGPAIALLAVQPAPGTEVSRLRLRHVRQTLTRAIAKVIEELRRGPGAPPLREIFVLTRTNIESQQVAATLRERGVPHVLYNQEGLYKADEAKHVRDLLLAIDEPRDLARRLRAALTPFFGLSLEDLPALAADPASHPIEERLASWRALADARDWARLFDRIVAESGVVERALVEGGSARGITNILHLFDLLRARATRDPLSIGDLARHLSGLVEALITPEPQEGNVQRIEGDGDAVQIMTIHKAKGLEADHVFVYGAFSPFRGAGVRAMERGGRRWLYAGKARRQALMEELDREQARDDQRLLYVALTRARKRLYLPYAGDAKIEENAPRDEDYWRVTGAYRHVHRRLRTLFGDRAAPHHFEPVPIDCPAPPDTTQAEIREAVRAWRPSAQHLRLDFHAEDLDRKRRLYRGIELTSYSRLKQAHGGYQPPTEVLDESPAGRSPAAPPDPGRLAGGTLSGNFLHAVLESVPKASFTGGTDAAGWAAAAEIHAIFDTEMRKHDRDPAHRSDAERMVHAAMTTPLALTDGTRLDGVARAHQLAREVEFFFPFPDAAGGAGAGFVKGYIDFIFEHGGRTYFGDWKSDFLPDFSPAALVQHMAANYEQQRRLYALALVKMLGISDATDYEARFGGTVYVFLRALPAGIEIGRPSWDDLQTWERELAGHVAAPDGGRS
jgi:exodeoxyribonuclease V beta subunit